MLDWKREEAIGGDILHNAALPLCLNLQDFCLEHSLAL